jgi:hypothetical protein
MNPEQRIVSFMLVSSIGFSSLSNQRSETHASDSFMLTQEGLLSNTDFTEKAYLRLREEVDEDGKR